MQSPALLEGQWLPTRAELDGEAAPELVLNRTKLNIRGTRYEIWFAGQIADSGKLVSVAATPHEALRFECTSGPTDGRVLGAIYQLQGNRLRICFGLDGLTPTAFSTAPASQRYLVYYRRSE